MLTCIVGLAVWLVPPAAFGLLMAAIHTERDDPRVGSDAFRTMMWWPAVVFVWLVNRLF